MPKYIEKYEAKGFFEIDLKYVEEKDFIADVKSDLQLWRIFVKNGLV